jgi:hypothetical protein
MSNISNNISSLSNPTLIGLAQSQLNTKNNIITAPIISKTDEIKARIKSLTFNRVKIEKEYGDKFFKLSESYSEGYITEQDRDEKYQQFEKQREEELKIQDEEIEKLNNDLEKEQKDLLAKAKKNKKRYKKLIKTKIKFSKSEDKKADRSRNLTVLRNVNRDIAPVISNLITNLIVLIVEKNSGLQELVDKTNEVIVNATTLSEINQARILRNNAIKILNGQEAKIIQIRNIVETIQKILNILSIVIRVIQIILSLGSPIPIPLPIKIKLQPILQKILKLVTDISVVLSITLSILNTLILYIKDLRDQLKNIGLFIDIKTSNPDFVIENDANDYIKSISNINNFNIESYKGFEFAIREENTPNAPIVAGNKRRYAVAIDTNNVEVLKGDLSFTQDPQDLVEILKLIIDRENLIA